MTARVLTMSESLSIQKALNAPPFSAHLDEDGHLGPVTQAALMRFQSEHAITPADGNPSLATTAALGIPDIFNPPTQRTVPMPNILGSLFSGLLGNLLNWQLIQGYLRSGLIGLGGVLVSNGYISGSQLNDAVGAVLVILGIIWSAVSNNTKVKAIEVVKAVDAHPDITVVPASQTSSGDPKVIVAK